MIEKAKKYFLETMEKTGPDIYGLLGHVPEMEKWANKLLKNYPDADREAVLLAVWLHDIAQYSGDMKIDHAIRSQKTAKEFLEKEGLDKDMLQKVLHCIRAHRNRDVKPETLEAKIIACADSASHMTDVMYFNIAKENKFSYLAGKIERDFDDISTFPEVKKELTPIFNAWKTLLSEYGKIKI